MGLAHVCPAGEATAKGVRASQSSLGPAANSPAQPLGTWGRAAARHQITGDLPHQMPVGNCRASDETWLASTPPRGSSSPFLLLFVARRTLSVELTGRNIALERLLVQGLQK